MRVTKVKSDKAARAKAPPTQPKSAARPASTKAAPKPAATGGRRSVPLASDKAGVKRTKAGTANKSSAKTAAPSPDGAMATGGNDATTPILDFNVCLRRAHQRMTEVFADVMQRYDISPSQYEALSKIAEMGAVSQSQLERQMALAPAELLALIGRLNRRGLVRPFAAPGDARHILLELSAEARAVMDDIKKAADQAASKLLAPLSPQEANMLSALLSRLG
jgi:DNA-binding MarR family transcriptional regulator